MVMPTLNEMDPRVSLVQQMEQDTEGPVVLINTFVLGPQDGEPFLRAWSVDAAMMKRQPGFISTQLHQGIGGSAVYVNCAVWESVEHFKRAFFNPEFQARVKEYPATVSVSPHLFKRIAVPGICVA
jgi:heme-degrading monooxygenase HmoA